MKIKSDFVTNSSSTSYIVFIPNNFVILHKHFSPKLELYDGGDLLNEANGDRDKVIDTLNTSLDQLKNTGALWEDYEEGELSSRLLFYAIANILDEQGFELETYDSGSEDGKIHNVGKYSNKLGSLILAESLSNITVNVKGVSDDTEDQK